MRAWFPLLLLLANACSPSTEVAVAGFHDLHDFKDKSSLPLLEVQEMQTALGWSLYLGKDDQLYDLMSIDAGEPPYPYGYSELEGDDPALLAGTGPGEIIIQVDTTNILSLPHYPELPEDLPVEQWLTWPEENKKEVQAYPVYIWNAGSHTAALDAEDWSLNPIVEAKDERGDWRPIEFIQHSGCGNSYWTLLLKPDYYVITSIYRYTGDFETEMRVAVASAYSKPFRGSINKSQFINTKPAEQY
ncbi:hypothetical protein D770_06760 [Flammeovirgaceae bacterium 311]|nr:hypothetical protein D770_06760 [Flammeovirgaceae bacterium 311]